MNAADTFDYKWAGWAGKMIRPGLLRCEIVAGTDMAVPRLQRIAAALMSPHIATERRRSKGSGGDRVDFASLDLPQWGNFGGI